MSSWDKGVDYDSIKNSLIWRINREKNPIRRAYYAILLIQLRNGARISEAIRAYKQWVLTGNREFYVKVSKKRSKKRKDDELRKMIIPLELDDSCKVWDLLQVPDLKLRNRLSAFATRNLRINTHSLRYAYITMLLKNGENPTVVAKITGHSELDYILTYTQKKEAERVLKEVG